MCIIEAKHFNKNGTTNFDCKAVTTDKIEAESTVTIQAAEVGKWCYVQFVVKNPDGSYTGYGSSQQIATLGIMTFTSSSTIPLVQGTYTLTEATIYTYNGSIWVFGCTSDASTGGMCSTLTVTVTTSQENNILSYGGIALGVFVAYLISKKK